VPIRATLWSMQLMVSWRMWFGTCFVPAITSWALLVSVDELVERRCLG